MMRIFRLSIFMILLGQLCACAALWDGAKKVGQIIWDPSTPVGGPGDQPTTVTYSMVAQEGANPNSDGAATPVEFQVFQLEDDSKLLAADYDSLLKDFEKALGSNYLDHSDYTMLPGNFKYIEAFEVDADTQYIGVVAHYGNPEISQWKKVIKIKPIGHEYHLLIRFKTQEVILDKVE